MSRKSLGHTMLAPATVRRAYLAVTYRSGHGTVSRERLTTSYNATEDVCEAATSYRGMTVALVCVPDPEGWLCYRGRTFTPHTMCVKRNALVAELYRIKGDMVDVAGGYVAAV